MPSAFSQLRNRTHCLPGNADGSLSWPLPMESSAVSYTPIAAMMYLSRWDAIGVAAPSAVASTTVAALGTRQEASHITTGRGRARAADLARRSCLCAPAGREKGEGSSGRVARGVAVRHRTAMLRSHVRAAMFVVVNWPAYVGRWLLVQATPHIPISPRTQSPGSMLFCLASGGCKLQKKRPWPVARSR